MTGLLLLVALCLSLIVVPVSGQDEVSCDAYQGAEICFTNTSVSESVVDRGGTVKLKFTARNVGNATEDAIVLVGVKQPEGGFTYRQVETLNSVEPGEEITSSVRASFEDGSTGVHELNFILLDGPQEHMFDSTGYYSKLIVEEAEPFDVVGAFKNLGIVAEAILLVATLVVGLLGGKWVWP